jgi:hypothetical protein
MPINFWLLQTVNIRKARVRVVVGGDAKNYVGVKYFPACFKGQSYAKMYFYGHNFHFIILSEWIPPLLLQSIIEMAIERKERDLRHNNIPHKSDSLHAVSTLKKIS